MNVFTLTRAMRRRWQIIYVGCLSLTICCCVGMLIILHTGQFRRAYLNGNWRFKRKIHKQFGVNENNYFMADIKFQEEMQGDVWNLNILDQKGYKSNEDDTIPAVNSTFLKEMTAYPKVNYTQKVLILSPIHNVAHLLNQYRDMVKSLSYPRHLISLAFGEDSSSDDTLWKAKMVALNLKKHFRRAQAIHLNLTGGIHGDWDSIHAFEAQFNRRRHLAESRNLLLQKALQDEDWVLWIDSDIAQMPTDIIQQLFSARKDIVAPSCIMVDTSTGHKRIYDKNTWRETPRSLKLLEKVPKDKLILEGYSPSYRIWLSHIRNEGRVVPLDGVGGCVLLIRADCHRNGLIFPSFIYKSLIETEALGKMAKDMGFAVYGMPFVEVIHS